jgi:uncharacterized membrane protein
MESRPKIKIELSATDRLLEIAGWLVLSLLWIITLFYYKNLPETIPTHFNAAGQADDYGSKPTMFLLPVLGTILFIGMTILNQFPQIFNYPVKITAENILKQYTMAIRMIRVLKLSILILFMMVAWLTNSTAFNGDGKQKIWFLPLMLGIIFIPLGFYIVRAFRNK